MRQHRGMALAALAVLSAGLLACGEAPRGTGKHGALFLHLPSYLVASGLWTRIEIPDRRYYPDGATRSYHSRQDSWNFEGATLEIDAPEGLDFEVTTVAQSDSEEARDFRERHESGGFLLRAPCNATPDVFHEVRLRVVADGQVRYEDAFDIMCRQATRLRLPRLTPGRYFVGGRVLAEVIASVSTALGPTPLGGEGLMLSDRRGLLRIEPFSHGPQNHIALLEVIAPGSGPELLFQDLTLRLPLETVEDPEWRLELVSPQPDREPPNSSRWALSARVIGSDGGELYGLHGCSWLITLPDDSTLQHQGCLAFVRTPAPPLRACVSALGRTACRDYL